MKRFIAIFTIFIFLGYILVAIYPYTPSFYQKSYTGKATRKIKKILAYGALFDRENAIISKSVSYRFYQNGKWQQSQLLLEPLFNDYVTTGNFAALKHCRLDVRLVVRINQINKHKGIIKMLKSKEYTQFTDHLFYRHNQNIKPDSLEVSYYVKDYETNSMNLSLIFKCKP